MPWQWARRVRPRRPGARVRPHIYLNTYKFTLWKLRTSPGGRAGRVMAEGPRRAALRRGYRGHADRRRRPDHPGHRGPGHASGQDRLQRGRVADPRRNLAAHLAGRERGDAEARWDELVPPYQDLAAKVG